MTSGDDLRFSWTQPLTAWLVWEWQPTRTAWELAGQLAAPSYSSEARLREEWSGSRPGFPGRK